MNTQNIRARDLDLDQPRRPTPVPVNDIAERQPSDLQPPTYGDPTRKAIESVVEQIVGDICKRIGNLHKTLDDIEQQVLTSAAGAKSTLQDHISTCVKINDEISHMQNVIEEIRVAAPK